LQQLDEPSLADFVAERVANAASGQGLKPATIAPPHLSPPHSRRRASLRAEGKEGKVLLGYRESGSHRIVDLAECPVLVPELVAERQQEIFDLRLNLEQELTLHAIRNMAKTDLKLIQSIQKQLNEAIKIAEAIAAQAPLAVVATRQNVLKAVEQGPLVAMHEFISVQRSLSNSEDAKEGVQSFIEKRVARFTGK
jgi:tRNA/tmRNA/rRNA uracil-C5-methylase (TrmA/RlmC/RlmD family)